MLNNLKWLQRRRKAREDGGETRVASDGGAPADASARGWLGRVFDSISEGTQPLSYAEIAIGLGLLVAINLLFVRDDLGFTGADPHPFWIVIVAIAARYGAWPGYAVGALSAVVYGMLVAARPGALDPTSLRVILDPVLFLLGGVALGELRESQKRSHRRLAERYEDVEAGLQDLAQRYLASMELARELERRIADQTSSVMTLYQAAKALERLDMRELSPSVLELVGSFVDADACSLYLRRDDGFVFEACRPAGAAAERPRELDTDRGMPAIAVGEKRTATVRDVVAEVTPAGLRREKMLMVTPLLSEDREVMGLLTIEKMPFLRFTPGSVKLFTLLGDWASSSFQRALRFQKTQDRNIDDEITGAYSYSYMIKRLDEELARAKRYGTPLTLIALRIEDYASMAPVRLPGVLRTVSLVLRHGTRGVDVLGKHSSDDTFLIILPHTGVEGAEILAGRLRTAVESFEFKPFDDDRNLRIGVGLASPSEDFGADALIVAALREIDAAEGSDGDGPAR